MSTIVPIRTPAAAPQPAADSDWAEVLAHDILVDISRARHRSDLMDLLVARLRLVRHQGVMAGFDEAKAVIGGIA